MFFWFLLAKMCVFRKEKLLKVIEDLEERAEVDVVVDSLSRDKIQPFRQLYDRLEV